VGVDIGTGSVRAFVYDAAGRRVAGVRLPYEWRVSTDGGVEIDGDAIVALTDSALRGAVDALPHDAGTIEAVGFSALWHTLLGVGADGRPVTPAFAWSDTRATAAARALRQQLDERAVHARTGGMLHPSYPVARLAWLRDERPAEFGAAAWWMSVPEYVWFRLTGERRVDISIAAGSGLLDQLTLQWDAELLDAVGVSAGQLSPLHAGSPADAPHPRPALQGLPRLAAAAWRQPMGDGACANIGSGCFRADTMALTIGTSAAVRTLLPWPAGTRVPPGLWLYRLDHDHAVIGGAISNGGLVRRWLRRTLRLPDDEARLEAQLVARTPAAHGIDVLPFLAGERSPHWPLDARAVFAGVRLATDAVDLLQAMMEAVAYRLALLRRRIRAEVPQARTIVASGAALQRSAYWTALVADVFGEPVHVTAEEEASSRGAAMLALLHAGVFDDFDELPAPPRTAVLPDMQRHEMHCGALERHLLLEETHAAGARRA
jgi:gluconokinase